MTRYQLSSVLRRSLEMGRDYEELTRECGSFTDLPDRNRNTKLFGNQLNYFGNVFKVETSAVNKYKRELG